MWRARERLQIDRPCDSIHAWVPSDRGESLCPVAKKPISENGESDQALASIASENFGLGFHACFRVDLPISQLTGVVELYLHEHPEKCDFLAARAFCV